MRRFQLQRGNLRREARLHYQVEAFAWQAPEPNIELDVTLRVWAALRFAHATQHVCFHIHTRTRTNEACEVPALPQHMVHETVREAFVEKTELNGRTEGRTVWLHDQDWVPTSRRWDIFEDTSEVEVFQRTINREIQDWPLEVCDPARLDDAIALYERATTDDTRHSTMAFIIYSFDYSSLRADHASWLEQTLIRDFRIHASQVQYWARWDDGPSGGFGRTSEIVRRVFATAAHPVRMRLE
jgi:hypothetical protein